MLKSNIIKFLLTIISGIGFFYYGKNIPFSEQWILYEALRNTSAIIFGVMGAWLAILYPSGLLNIFGKKENMPDTNTSKNVKKFFPPIVYSTLILSYVLMAGVIAPLLKTIPILMNYKDILRGLSYSIIGMLTLVQLWALILTLVPSYILHRKLDHHESKEAQRKRMFSKTQKKRKG
ncbi:hypothetical protein DSCW_01170 [Desulfosarcina widdelii]|uniref:Uncharacterized protein n=1 Tax=Desulfosarcina widdelii TaxID=947919 RepID=A0A5K7YWJ3_9BACT|nr:hypothetical protein [Desulfosarcina widdelii]BBO72700.1 hypothetical protein DSCW_01170 [Desulfosarcina widdelii]